MIRAGTKIAYTQASSEYRKTGETGVIVEKYSNVYLVRWDKGDVGWIHERYITPFHKLKAAFKRGPKIRKRA